MPSYRAYLIDLHDRVASYKAIEAQSDSEAMEAARRCVDGFDVEVWHLDRMVGRLPRARR